MSKQPNKPTEQPTQLARARSHFYMLFCSNIGDPDFLLNLEGLKKALDDAQNPPPMGGADGSIDINMWNVLTRFVRGCKTLMSDGNVIRILMSDDAVDDKTEPNMPRNNPAATEDYPLRYNKRLGKLEKTQSVMPEEPLHTPRRRA